MSAPAGFVPNATVIGLTATAEHDAARGVPGERASTVARPYIEAVVAVGAIPVLLPPIEADEAALDRLLGLVDGVILTGGLDLDPTYYGQPRHPLARLASPLRDSFELALARRAVQRGVPLLGICRGMQVLNVALGGSLHQHLPDIVGHTHHTAAFDRELVAGSPSFNIRVDSGSKIGSWAGNATTYGWSNHHQGIDALAPGLVASAWAEDGLIVAVEMPSTAIAGVQWHPEVDPNSRVITGFIAAATDAVVDSGVQHRGIA